VKADVGTEGHPAIGIKFHPDQAAVFSKRQKLQALACPSCGYLELFLVSENESSQPPGLGTWVFA
jgi:hypothetical protein